MARSPIFGGVAVGCFGILPSSYGKRQASAGSLLDQLLKHYEASQHRAGGEAEPGASALFFGLPGSVFFEGLGGWLIFSPRGLANLLDGLLLF